MERSISFVEAAKAMENKMAKFYADTALRADNPKVRSLLERISLEEKSHAKWVEMNIEPIESSKETLNKAFRRSGSFISAAMTSLNDVDGAAERLSNDRETLAFAIQAEQDILIFYGQLARLVESPELKKQISKLVDFEYEHIEQFADILFRIQSGNP